MSTSELGSLQVEHLSKSFYLYRNDAYRFLACFWPRIQPKQEYRILKDLHFSIPAGQSIGIVGHNGAGKSTLLKLLTGTLSPTSGRIHTHGRIAAILELGMGFNYDLNATENVLHVGGLMGLSREELVAQLDNIKAFADIGEHFEQPMRLYSSGMQVRVAFALATAVRPDILIVDEALSVGDAAFQHKCFERINQFRKEGTTLLFVSHDAAAVLALCDRCLLINGGELVMDGKPAEVMDYYNALIAEADQSVATEKTIAQELGAGGVQTRSGTGEMRLEHIELCVNEQPATLFQVGQTVQLRIQARCTADLEQLVFGYMIKDRLGQPMFGTNTFHTEQLLHHVKAGEQLSFTVDFPLNIGVGNYSISTSFSSGADHLSANYEWVDGALVFQVLNNQHPAFVGSAWVPPTSLVIRRDRSDLESARCRPRLNTPPTALR